MMTAAELRAKSTAELLEVVKTISKEIDTISSDILKGKSKNVKKIHALKKDLARVNTVFTEKRYLAKETNE